MFTARTLAKSTAGALAAAAIATALAVPATAEDVEVQFTVETNNAGLSVSSAAASAAVDDGGSNPLFDALSNASFSDALPSVTVTDERGTLLAGWSLSVSGEDFVNTSDGSQTVAASNARVYNNFADASALTTALGGLLSGMTVTGGEYNAGGNDLSAPYTLLSGATPLGDGSVQVTPTMDVTVPAGTPAGTYTATVTYTAS